MKTSRSSGLKILDFQVGLLSGQDYSFTVCERLVPQTTRSSVLVSVKFSSRADFLTDFGVDRLNASTLKAPEHSEEIQGIGKHLYQRLFTSEVESIWNKYKQTADFLILCLRFAPEAKGLEVLPWETMYDGYEFIAAGAKTTLTRLPSDCNPPTDLPPIPQPLKLLGFFASPLDLNDYERLNVEREQEILLEAINDPSSQGRIAADFEDEATLESLERNLGDGYHILHITGHGINPREGGGLLLEDSQGARRPASISEVKEAVKRDAGSLRLVVLSGCQTARTLHSASFQDLSRELLRQGVPAVVAMQFSISDEGGLKFAEVLYREIARGVRLEFATHKARRCLLEDPSLASKNDAAAIVLLTGDGDCLRTTRIDPGPSELLGLVDRGDNLDPLVHGFYGRRREYRRIRDALRDHRCRAVVIEGIGGIGKTALLTQVIKRMCAEFTKIISFDCRRASLGAEIILLELHRYFVTQGIRQLEPLIGAKIQPETLANYLAPLITQSQLLIVLDNFETQLDLRGEIANDELRVLLLKLLELTTTGGQFFITTRYAISFGDPHPEYIVRMQLGNLSRSEGLMLMQRLPRLAQQPYRSKLATLSRFGGHPYALIALNRYCNSQSLDSALRDTASLTSEIREYVAIELIYKCLNSRARDLLNRLASFRGIVPSTAVQWVIGSRIPASEMMEVVRPRIPDELKSMSEEEWLEVLKRGPEVRRAVDAERCVDELIKWGLLSQQSGDDGISIAVHELIRDFCRDQLPFETWREQLRDCAKFFSNLIRLSRNEENLSNAWNRIEVFELLMEAGDFEQAAWNLVGAHNELNRRGFGRFLQSQYRRVEGKLDGITLAAVLHNQAVPLQQRGEYASALELYERAFAIADGLKDQEGISKSLLNIGRIHHLRGEHGEAMSCYRRALLMNEERGDRAMVATALNNIGTLQVSLEQYDDAFEQYQRALSIYEDLGDRAGVAVLILNIGAIHQSRGDYEAAVSSYNQSLKIHSELGNRSGMALSLTSIAVIHEKDGDYEAALNRYQEALTIREELGDRPGLADLSVRIGMIHLEHEEYGGALEWYQKLVSFEAGMGASSEAAKAVISVGMIHRERGEYQAALASFQQALAICEAAGDHTGMGAALIHIRMIHQDRGDDEAAFEQYHRAMAFQSDKDDTEGVAMSLMGIGMIHQQRGEYDAALEQYLKALAIRKRLRNQVGIARATHQIGTIYQARGKYKVALEHYHEALAIVEELGNRDHAAIARAQIGKLFMEMERYPEAFPMMMSALATFFELQAPYLPAAAEDMRLLRKRWGATNFDAACKLKTNEELPRWLTKSIGSQIWHDTRDIFSRWFGELLRRS
jgi:tetratricopeptide (TPR) repeat protein/CHAT domain-containing protein